MARCVSACGASDAELGGGTDSRRHSNVSHPPPAAHACDGSADTAPHAACHAATPPHAHPASGQQQQQHPPQPQQQSPKHAKQQPQHAQQGSPKHRPHHPLAASEPDLERGSLDRLSSAWSQYSLTDRLSHLHLPKAVSSRLPRLAREDMAQIRHMLSTTRKEAVSAAAHAAENAVHGVNEPLSGAGHKWLDLRRRAPRFVFFPVLVLAVMAACCSWVVPVTLVNVQRSRKDVTIQECYMMYGGAPPPRYAATTAAAGDGEDAQLVANASRGCYTGRGAARHAVEPTPRNFRAALADMQPAIVAGITANDSAAAATWSTKLPELRYLGSIGMLKPRGAINPVSGVLALVLSWSPAAAYPGTLPMASAAVAGVAGGVGPPLRSPFVITWHVTCNGGSAACRSDEACGVLLVDCSTDLVSQPGHSLSLYPWDRYYFSVHISVHAIVKNLDTGEVHRVGVPMLFQFEQSTSTYFIHQSFSEGEVQVAGFEAQQASYVFPAVYDDATSSGLLLVNAFKMRRAAIVIAWSMFVVVVMWLLSVGMLLTVLDLYWRPRSMFDGMQFSTVGLLWTVIMVRNTQPDVPPIGIVIDVAGFLWNWLFVAAAALICMSTAYEQYRHGDHLRKTKQEKAEKQAKEEATRGGGMTERMRSQSAGALHALLTVAEEASVHGAPDADAAHMRRAQSYERLAPADCKQSLPVGMLSSTNLR